MRRSKFQIFLLVSKGLSGKPGPWIRYVFAFCVTLQLLRPDSNRPFALWRHFAILMIGDSKACDNNIIPGDSMS